MVRSFTVKPPMASQIGYIGEWLDEMLVNLQNTGWKILSVRPSSYALYDYNQHKYVSAPMYIIVAKGGDYDALEEKMGVD